MGTIQQSINAALKTTTTAAALSRGAVYYDNQKEAELIKEKAELTKAENERIAGQQGVLTEAADLQKEVQESEKAGSELDTQINEKKAYIGNINTPRDKAMEAEKQLKALQEQKKLQEAQFASRMESFRKRKELIDQKASLYGMGPIDIFNEGGKE